MKANSSVQLIANKLITVSEKIERIAEKSSGKSSVKNARIPEIITFLTYIILHIIVMLFHEPWMDEATAWTISKNAGYKEMLFEVPHYEGHPQLWHIVLSFFSKTGVDYELGLMIVTTVFSALFVYLVIFKSPFKRITRLIIPFTYFSFYQFAIVARPYVMSMAAFAIMAIFYEKRDEKPGRYVLGLVFLSLTTVYGLMMAGGIAFAWVVQIFLEKKLFKDKRTCWLAGLLIFAVALLATIMPYSDTNAISQKAGENIGYETFIRFIYMMFALIPDVNFTKVITSYPLLDINMSGFDFKFAVICGLVIWGIIYYYGRKAKTFLMFIVPYMTYAVFSTFVYCALYHNGMIWCLLLFWIWCTYVELGKQKNTNYNRYIKTAGVYFAVFSLVISCYWSIAVSYNEVNTIYSLGKYEAEYIIDNGLEGYDAFTSWRTNWDGSDNTRFHARAEDVMPYLDRNIFVNYDFGNDKAYLINKTPSKEEADEDMSRWKRMNPPDIVLGILADDYNKIYEASGVKFDSYECVFYGECSMLWKDVKVPFYKNFMFVKKELVDSMHLESVRLVK